MHVITRKRLNEFAAAHPNAAPGLQHWYAQMKAGSFRSFAELRALFSSADQVGKLTVFNISGNTVRLIAAIHYNRQKAGSFKVHGTGRPSRLKRRAGGDQPQARMEAAQVARAWPCSRPTTALRTAASA